MGALPEEDETIPMAPQDLARAYATVALGYHQDLPLVKASAEAANRNAMAAFELCGQVLGEVQRIGARVEQVADKVGAPPPPEKKLPSPPRMPSPSGHELEPEEVTLHGKPIPVVHGEVTLTTSDFVTLKRTIAVARESWSIAQKVIVAVGAAIVLGMGTFAGVTMHAAWGAAKTVVVSTPPVVVSAPADAGH